MHTNRFSPNSYVLPRETLIVSELRLTFLYLPMLPCTVHRSHHSPVEFKFIDENSEAKKRYEWNNVHYYTNVPQKLSVTLDE